MLKSSRFYNDFLSYRENLSLSDNKSIEVFLTQFIERKTQFSIIKARLNMKPWITKCSLLNLNTTPKLENVSP